MALLWVEGFEKWADTGNSPASGAMTSKYMANYDQLTTAVAGRYSGKAMSMGSTSVIIITPDLNPQSDTLIVGLNFRINTFTDTAWVWDLRHPYNDGETIGWGQFTLKTVNSGNQIELALYRGNTSLNTTSNLNLQEGTWYAIEAKVKCHDTLGTANIYVDHTEVLTFSGDTRHRSVNGGDRYSKVTLRTHVIPSHSYDDLYVMDDTGNTNNSPLLENWRVEALSPDGDASGNWTPSTGNTLYDLLDEDTRDSNYISETASGNRAVFTMSNLSSNGATGTIRGVQLNVESSKQDRYKKVAKIITQNGSGGSLQTECDIVSSQNSTWPVDTTRIMETDPDGNAWTAATVNDLRIGVEVK